MKKALPILLVAVCVGVSGWPADADARDLSSLLGARAQLEARQSIVKQNDSRPKVDVRAAGPREDFRSLDSQKHATPRFPILRKLIKLYILWALLNPYA